MRLQQSMLLLPIDRPHELLGQEIRLVRAFEQLNMPNVTGRVLRTGARRIRGSDVERLVPARGPKRAVVAHEVPSTGHAAFAT